MKVFDKEKFLQDFNRIKENREKGYSPVFNEMRCARTNLIECIPFAFVEGVIMIGATILLEKWTSNELLSVAIVLLVKQVSNAFANFIFTFAKHRIRKKFLEKLGLKFTEENVAILESMEYQTI